MNRAYDEMRLDRWTDSPDPVDAEDYDDRRDARNGYEPPPVTVSDFTPRRNPTP